MKRTTVDKINDKEMPELLFPLPYAHIKYYCDTAL